jgi:hypothetical protein
LSGTAAIAATAVLPEANATPVSAGTSTFFRKSHWRYIPHHRAGTWEWYNETEESIWYRGEELSSEACPCSVCQLWRDADPETQAKWDLKLAPRNTIMLVCGGRDYADKERLHVVLNGYLLDWGVIRVIAGGARGVDSFAEQWAKAQEVECVVYRADWAKHGRAAGPIRNRQMLDEGRPTLVVAFPGGRGTADMIRRARSAGIEVAVIDKDCMVVRDHLGRRRR